MLWRGLKQRRGRKAHLKMALVRTDCAEGCGSAGLAGLEDGGVVRCWADLKVETGLSEREGGGGRSLCKGLWRHRSVLLSSRKSLRASLPPGTSKLQLTQQECGEGRSMACRDCSSYR